MFISTMNDEILTGSRRRYYATEILSKHSFAVRRVHLNTLEELLSAPTN